ncbi:MAG: tol-pal system protein YbgF, partial [Proteobacteria bacterium]|nr:tol-pal system protein YbgF [Pseudomonadota bacterium]
MKISFRFLLFTLCSLLPALCLFPGCLLLTKNDGIVISARLDTLESKVNRLDQDLPRLKAQSEANQKELERLTRQQADLLNQIEQIKQTILSLGGKFEEGENLFSRLKTLEGQVKEQTDQLKEKSDRIKEQNDRLAKLEGIISPGGQVDSQKLTPKWPNEEAGYREAYSNYQGKKYDLARAKFEKLIGLYPNGQFSDTARYWIGECYFSLKDYERALLSFNEVIEKYPKSSKVPNAYLKLGLSFQELGQQKEAQMAFETLVSKFPKS